MATGSDIFLVFLALLFPPLPVWVKCGLCSPSSLINLLLCMLGVVPGLLHAWYIIFTTPDPYDVYQPVGQDSESVAAAGSQPRRQNDNVRYVYVYQAGGQPQSQNGHAQRVQGGQQGYGTAMPSNGTFGSSEPQPQLAPHQSYQSAPSGSEAPPAYEAAIQGDNKVQRS